MKVSKLFKDKKQMVTYMIAFLVMLLAFIYVGGKDYKKDVIPDNDKFDQEFSLVGKDNVFSYIQVNQAYSYVRRDNVIILFGNSNNPWVNKYASILNQVAKEVGLKEIYYYDVTEDRKENNASYQAIVRYLSDYITYLDDGSANIYGPTLLVKTNGIITLFDDEVSLIKGNQNPMDYFDNYQTGMKENLLLTALSEYKEVN